MARSSLLTASWRRNTLRWARQADRAFDTDSAIGHDHDGVDSPLLPIRLLRTAVVQLTNAQALTLKATPITLVAGPGANKAILVHAAFAVCDAAAGAYTETAANIAIEYADGTDILVMETTGWIDGAAVRNRIQRPDHTTAAVGLIANSAVRAFNNGAAEWGGGNAANTLSFLVYYSVVDAIKFSS